MKFVIGRSIMQLQMKNFHVMGMFGGDGVVNNKHSMVRLCGEQNKFVDRFIGCGFGSSQPMSIVGDTIVYTGKYLKTTPELALKTWMKRACCWIFRC